MGQSLACEKTSGTAHLARMHDSSPRLYQSRAWCCFPHSPGTYERLPADAGWLYLVGDLTALPAMARIVETVGDAVECDPCLMLAAHIPHDVTDADGVRF